CEGGVRGRADHEAGPVEHPEGDGTGRPAGHRRDERRTAPLGRRAHPGTDALSVPRLHPPLAAAIVVPAPSGGMPGLAAQSPTCEAEEDHLDGVAMKARGALLLLLALAGCARHSVGPRTIRPAQFGYNEAISRSW